MHRAVVLTTLVLLLLAVAGVSAAQESGIFAGRPSSDNPPGSITQESTDFEATLAQDTMMSVLPSASSEPKDGEGTSEPSVVTEPSIGETEKPSAVVPDQESLIPGSNNIGKPGSSVGKPEHAGKASNIDKPHVVIGHPANVRPEERGNEEEPVRGGSQQKITLCHKDKNTLTVGAPAQEAHLRHGDILGACR
jgi:hypothetical protein